MADGRDSKSVRMLFICQTIDYTSHVQGNAVYVIKSFAEHPNVESVDAIALRVGPYELPENTRVHSLDHPRHPSSLNRIATLYRFYRRVVTAIRSSNIDVIYCYSTPRTPVLLSPIKLFSGVKVCSWHGHTVHSMWGKLSNRFFTDLWFTANRATAPYSTQSLRLVGQGINSDLFREAKTAKDIDFITVGRISSLKRMELIIEGFSLCKEQQGAGLNLLICGDPITQRDVKYKEDLIALIKRLGLEDSVRFAGQVPYHSLPELLNRSKCFVFATPGGVSKAVMEAMSCALPIVVAEPNLTDFFPREISRSILCEGTAEQVGEKMAEMINRSDDERREIGQSLRRLVDEKYNLRALTDRIVTTIKNELV